MSNSILERARKELAWAEDELRKSSSDRDSAARKVKALRTRLSNLEFSALQLDLEMATVRERARKQREGGG